MGNNKLTTATSHVIHGDDMQGIGFKDFKDKQVIFESYDVDQDVLSKYVKLRFTPKQYAIWREACNMFDIIAKHPDFIGFVLKAIGSDLEIREQSIVKQLIEPIVTAPTKIVAQQSRTSTKVSYFTKPIPVTKEARKLYDAVKKDIDKTTLKQDVESDVTCVTDIRKFVNKYIKDNKLDNNVYGVELTKQFTSFAPKTIKAHEKDFVTHNGKSYMPTAMKMKVVSGMINEIAIRK